MMEEIENIHISISSDQEIPSGMDFDYLRQEGISYLQRITGQVWTDFNTHDPGITILDQLCYALNDLSYRIEHPIPDLIADPNGKANAGLFHPAEILSCNAVTLLDIRKEIIDVPGVKNAWVEAIPFTEPDIYLDPEDKSLSLADDNERKIHLPLKGLYRVFIEKKESESRDIQPAVRRRLMSCRNICEDFAQVKTLSTQEVSVAAVVEIDNIENINLFAFQMLKEISLVISPRIPFYTLEEMLERGKSMDEILDGPILNQGFIDNDELERFDRKKELRVSDLIRTMMDVNGVKAVSAVQLIGGGRVENWVFELDEHQTPKVNAASCLDKMNFYKKGLQIHVNHEEVLQMYEQFLRDDALIKENKLPQIPSGTYRETGAYYSIQHQFPRNYGIGEFGLTQTSTKERKAKAHQLKAYLSFFDQLLANYFRQLGETRQLFDFSAHRHESYFGQTLSESVPHYAWINEFKNEEEYAQWLAEAGGSEDVHFERKNRILNHLLARFAENFTDYSLMIFGENSKGSSMEAKHKILHDKTSFLNKYPMISAQRFKAFDYHSPYPETSNRSGLEERIAARLGISLNEEVLLTDLKEGESFYSLEHILLRPVKEDFSAYNEFMSSRPINGFQIGETGLLRVLSTSHGLIEGEWVTINGTGDISNPHYDGSYQAQNIYPDWFEIAFEPGLITEINTPEFIAVNRPSWIRTYVDTTFMLLNRPVESWEAVPGVPTQTMITAQNHELRNGELIEINGNPNYNGVHTVIVENKDKFIIEHPYAASEAIGRWISVNQKRDPFSLQMTFIFPDWLGRCSKDHAGVVNFRHYVEQVIREETPPHITVYIRWFGLKQMMEFETVYFQFLDQMQLKLSN